MTKLHQIQFRYDPHEDRALLRIITSARQEFRFWVTRRYAKLMWAGLIKSTAPSQTIASEPPSSEAVREAMIAFEQEAAIAQADFKTQLNDSDTTTPLGDAPVLLARLKCAKQPGDIILLAMHPLQGQGIEIRLDQTLLHSMLKLLAEAASAGEWDMNTAIAQPEPQRTLN